MPETDISVDIAVVGGGAAGIAAAVTAARAGAATLLVDRQCMLGGMGSAALVHTICGLYLLRDAPGAHFAHEGFPREFAERLLKMGGASPPVRMGRLDVLPHDPAAFALLSDIMTGECRNLKVWLHCELSAVHTTASRVTGFNVLCCGQERRVVATHFVDASGDANLLHLANSPTTRAAPEDLQRPGYVVGLSGLPTAALSDGARLAIAHAIVSGIKDGSLSPSALGAGFRQAIHEGHAFLTIDLKGHANDEPYNPTDPACLAEVTRIGRRTATEIITYLRTRQDGFKYARISQWPARPGIRETRRATGRYELKGADILSGATFPDGAAVSTWPLELRENPRGPRWRFPETGAIGHIPLRSLQSASLDNVHVAGRCISCDHDAQAAIRVMATCMATGEAAAKAFTDGNGLAR